MWGIIVSASMILLIVYYWNIVKYYFRLLLLYGHFAVTILVIMVMFNGQKYGRYNALKFAQIYSHVIKLLGIKYEIRNEQNILNDEGAIVVINHQHFLDILTEMYILHKTSVPFTVILKKKLVPLCLAQSVAKNALGTIFINNDGSTDEQVREDLQAAVQLISTDKLKFIVYPEGTRNSSGKLLPFKKGGFKMAIQGQIPIIPIVLSPLYFIDSRKKIFNNGRIVADILKPIPTTGLTLDNIDDVVKTTYERMSKKFSDLQKEVLTFQHNNE